MTTLHPVVAEVTERLRERSRETRTAYLETHRRGGPRRTAARASVLRQPSA
ncbi:hypothetical protein RLIN73S_04242 [Rhodanobacter lindaniclasticus]